MTRTYQMTRIDAGDYLLPSNDAKTLWRIRRYYEDGSAEYGDGTKLVGYFWSCAHFRMPLLDITPSVIQSDDFLADRNWVTCADTMKTRREAIAEALS